MMLANARSKLADLSKADEGSAASLQQELAGLMKEMPEIYSQAMVRTVAIRVAFTSSIQRTA